MERVPADRGGGVLAGRGRVRPAHVHRHSGDLGAALRTEKFVELDEGVGVLGFADPDHRPFGVVNDHGQGASTIRERNARPCPLLRRATNRVNAARSSSVSTRGCFGRPVGFMPTRNVPPPPKFRFRKKCATQVISPTPHKWSHLPGETPVLCSWRTTHDRRASRRSSPRSAPRDHHGPNHPSRPDRQRNRTQMTLHITVGAQADDATASSDGRDGDPHAGSSGGRSAAAARAWSATSAAERAARAAASASSAVARTRSSSSERRSTSPSRRASSAARAPPRARAERRPPRHRAPCPSSPRHPTTRAHWWRGNERTTPTPMSMP